jgi:hypothetical protein
MNNAADELYRNIAEALAEAAPKDWAATWLTAIVHDDHAKVEYDYQSQDGKQNWFDPGLDAHNRIAMSLIKLRQAMGQPNLKNWNNITFRLERSGKFTADVRHDPKQDI